MGDRLLHVAVLEGNYPLSRESGESSVDLLAEKVEQGVDDERAGLMR